MKTTAEKIGIGVIALLLLTSSLALVSLILNIVILSNQSASSNKIVERANDSASGENSGSTTPTTQPPPTTACPSVPTQSPTEIPPVINSSDGFKVAADEAARILMKGLDLTVDPCVDFYAFTCNTYLKNNPLANGQRRIGTYDETQLLVNDQIRQGIEAVQANIDARVKVSLTEKIVANAYALCMESAKNGATNKAAALRDTIFSQFHGFPAFTSDWKEFTDMQAFWRTVGRWESQYGIPSLLGSYVSVDYEDVDENALYFNQLELTMPRDFYVKPQFLAQSDAYLELTKAVLSLYNKSVDGGATDEAIERAATEAVQFETQLALAMVSDDLLRNYKQQYNRYTTVQLASAYPSISFGGYISGLGIEATASESFVVVEPAYFGVLDTILEGRQWKQSTIVNFISIRMLLGNLDFLGDDFTALKRQLKVIALPDDDYRRQLVELDELGASEYDRNSQSCINMLENTIPFGVGFIYVRGIDERLAVRDDVALQTGLVIDEFLAMVDTLEWITEESKSAARNKSANLVKNVGWPDWLYGDFKKTDDVDLYHGAYKSIATMTDYFDTLMALNAALQETENFGLLNTDADRRNFLMSPAIVNAWYQPERNSITFPFAAFNPPYYRYDFPQAYNYAGQGGTAGHELSHGFDDEGVQFGPHGELSDCDWSRCGWMDKNSTLGFIDMAQCVVSQYSSQCCPVKTGSVHCANGATTQGENIADLAGQQAAYRAYRTYVAEHRNGEEEGRLPSLEQFTPNQIFWITYGYSWCMNWSEETLVNLLLTNPHAPGSCRVNQVVQDIPEFGRDFNCPIGSPMYPVSSSRCKVWTGN